MTTKILTIIFAILAGICYSLYRGILVGYILLVIGMKKMRKSL